MVAAQQFRHDQSPGDARNNGKSEKILATGRSASPGFKANPACGSLLFSLGSTD
jgi:hypothetical protein